MRTIILSALNILSVFRASHLYAEESEWVDSYTIQRLLVLNQHQQVLLVHHANGWMTPALRHRTNATIQQGLQALAADLGGRISSPTLAGMFMFLPEYKKGASFRQYFRASWLAGDLVTPAGMLDARWFSVQEAARVMSQPAKIVGAEKEMTLWLLNHPEEVWGGSYSLFKQGSKTAYTVTEPFFAL